MPRAARSRIIPAPAGEVWRAVADPYHLPRWWPRAERVENVQGAEGERPDAWTLVLLTKKGKPVRADYRLLEASEPDRYVFEQEVEGTPFAGILATARTEITLAAEEAGTRVRIAVQQKLRGMSRFGSPLVRRATGRQLEGALEGLEAALAGGVR